MDDNLEKCIILQNHCGNTVRDMVDEIPDKIIDPLMETKNKREMRKNLFSLIMSFITYLFADEYIILKRKDRPYDAENR